MKALIFEILGAIEEVLHWRYTISLAPAFLPAEWKTVASEGLIQVVGGFVVGWAIGFASRKIGPD